MSLKDKATTAAIIGNVSTFQVLQKVKAVVFPPPSFLLVHLMKRKDCKVSSLLLLYLPWLKRKGRLSGRSLTHGLTCSWNCWRCRSGEPRDDVFDATLGIGVLSPFQGVFPLPGPRDIHEVMSSDCSYGIIQDWGSLSKAHTQIPFLPFSSETQRTLHCRGPRVFAPSPGWYCPTPLRGHLATSGDLFGYHQTWGELLLGSSG